jgi:hypothetical protein
MLQEKKNKLVLGILEKLRQQGVPTAPMGSFEESAPEQDKEITSELNVYEVLPSKKKPKKKSASPELV